MKVLKKDSSITIKLDNVCTIQSISLEEITDKIFKELKEQLDRKGLSIGM